MPKLSHAIGFDDAPFSRSHRGNVTIVGAVFAGARMDGVITARVRRDGANAAEAMALAIAESRFVQHVQLIFLQGIAVAGFNVVDVFRLHRISGLPVIVVSRKKPDFEAIREALLTRVRGGDRKWKIIERLGEMERAGGVWIQRVGVTAHDAETALARFAIYSNEPEPLRIAHMIAAVAAGQ